MPNRKLKAGMKLVEFPIFLLLVFPISIFSDHACIDERPNGTKVERKKRLPREWFLIGEKMLTDQSLHTGISSRYIANYVVKDKNFGSYCGIVEGVYVTVSNTDFGPWAEFASIPPKCWRCNPTKSDSLEFISGSRLKIGQDKATAATVLGVEFTGDIVEVLFQEKKKNRIGVVWHTESIKMEFNSEKLIRFSVSDNTEPD